MRKRNVHIQLWLSEKEAAALERHARAAGITWRTVIIPVAVALLIYSKIPYISNPIIYILLGAFGGYMWFCGPRFRRGRNSQH